jgi:3-isopropylmalate/(R)-2-methylmalate dehydratase small subunit
VDLNTGRIENLTSGSIYQAEPFPDFMQDIINPDGLIDYVRGRMGQR